MLRRGDIVRRDLRNSFFTGVVLTVYYDLEGIERVVLEDPRTKALLCAEATDVKVLVRVDQIPITRGR